MIKIAVYLGVIGAVLVAMVTPKLMLAGYLCWLASNGVLIYHYKELRLMYCCYMATTLLGIYNLVSAK